MITISIIYFLGFSILFMPNILIKLIWTKHHLRIFFSETNLSIETKVDRTFHYVVHVCNSGRKFNMAAMASKALWLAEISSLLMSKITVIYLFSETVLHIYIVKQFIHKWYKRKPLCKFVVLVVIWNPRWPSKSYEEFFMFLFFPYVN